MNCSKCDEPSAHSILVFDGEETREDKRSVRVVRFCETHWRDIVVLLP